MFHSFFSSSPKLSRALYFCNSIETGKLFSISFRNTYSSVLIIITEINSQCAATALSCRIEVRFLGGAFLQGVIQGVLVKNEQAS